jgi:TnpA family transposase
MSTAIHDGIWDLTLTDRPLVEAKRLANRLGFAVMLLFFRARGRFPRAAAEVDGAAVTKLARSLGVPEPNLDAPLIPDAADRTMERQRAEIRALLGFREAGVADAEALGTWLRDHAVAKTRDPAELAADAEARCRSLRIEPPTPDRIARIVRTAVHAYEDKRVATVHARLTSAMRVGLDALLQSPGPQGAAEVEDMAAPDGKSDAPLIHLRAGPGRASVASLRDELARLDTVRGLGLPDDLFADWSRNELEACRQRVAVEAPYELRRHPDATRHAWLAAYAHLRGRSVIDTLVDLLIETVHHIGARAEHRVEQDLLDDLKRVGGKQALLYRIAGAAVERPDGSVREVLYPVVGEQTFRDLVREAKATGPTYRTTLRATIRSSYRGHYRRAVLDLLAALDFRSNNDAHRPVIQALDLVRRYAGTRLQTYPADETVPIDGVVRLLWRDAVVESDPQGRPRVNRITYEICAIEALREQLRCKEIWVAGADRYRNPDEDLPADFDARRDEHYAALGLPRSAGTFLAGLQEDMRVALSRLDRDLPRNPDVRISRKAGGWIHLTPLQPKPLPVNIDALKTDVADAWPMTSLLDMLKEADLRVGITDYLRSSTAYEALDRAVLRPRLLLCLNGLGTNAGLKRMASSHLGASYKDLLYVRRRYINPDQLREAIAAVTNATLRARDPLIWGEGTNACASDSKHFGAWDQNLTTQWHVRYGGRGVMIYWHVERKSLCIHSQLKSPSSSEVASMIEGVLRHCTELEVDRQYVDSHGQSVVAFAFTKLLGFQLLPRLKAIHAQRLYRPDTGQPDAYPNLQPVLSRPIDWELIGRQYDEMVKYATAMRLGTADAEAILRRFTRENTQHPTYKALSELGKAVKTAFLARYLADQALRREINDGLNVVEQWNSANDFIFFARHGEFSSNRRENQELSMLSLHLLQNCMVYVNTLMVQQVLARPKWKGRLNARDFHALTPLFWGHVNPYGRFELDMATRIHALA